MSATFLNLLRFVVVGGVGLGLSAAWAAAPAGRGAPPVSWQWRDEVTGPAGKPPAPRPSLQLVRQDFEQLEFGRSVVMTPLKLLDEVFPNGLGTHAVSHIRVLSEDPLVRFVSSVGVDHNEHTLVGDGSVVFRVVAGGKELYRSATMKARSLSQKVDVKLDHVRELDLHVDDGGDGCAYDHADWAGAEVHTASGRRWRLDELPLAGAGEAPPPFPFSFTYDGRPGAEWLRSAAMDTRAEDLDAGRSRETRTWTEAGGGLRVTCETVRYADYPAIEWLLRLENTGSVDTRLIENVRAMDILLAGTVPLPGGDRYRLHRAKGGVPDATQFEPAVGVIDRNHPQRLWAGGGRSSTADFPFFKIHTGRGSVVIAVGWSGCWEARAECRDERFLRVTAGLEKTRFVLRPGETVRMPRMLALFWSGDTLDSNAAFRELIAKHYAARRDGKAMPPMLFCNTCFTRGGAWLNECNAANQISLIEAYAPLGLEALVTDAGWFKGGWPAGAGNWTPREDAYPQGMGPVAAAAQAKGMIYGLWFEPERVVANTDLHRNHPDWLLRRKEGDDDTYLVNFGLPEVQDYFFGIVKGFMDLPGFRFYRQDFNMDPLPYWRFSDAPDRQGITEIRYVEGLYAYWDRLASTWPDSVREECASGGHRIDLETVMRMHLHQKTDYWFDNETDQAALWSVSQYLPNGTIVAHLSRLDDYSFHSTLASSLCLGWVADGPAFGAKRAKLLTDRYRAVRYLLNGAWYPLLPYSRSQTDWIGSQYHRSDLDEGMLLVFRRGESPYRTVDVSLRGLGPHTRYELVSDASGALGTFTGAELGRRYSITLPEKKRSDLILYRAVQP